MYTDAYATAGATRADHAYAELKRRLLSGEFALNVRLGEERLASLIGMSRTPIREALVRLAGDGLVTLLPNRSTVVSQIDFPNLHHFFDALTDWWSAGPTEASAPSPPTSR